METGTIVYQSATIFGNQGIAPNGSASGMEMGISSGAYPSTAYRITSAVFSVDFRDVTWATVTVHSLADDVQLGSFGIGGQPHHDIALSTEYNYQGITGIRLKSPASQGASLKGGSRYTLTLTWELADQPSVPTVATPYVYAGDPVTVTCTPYRPTYRHVIAIGLDDQWAYGNMPAGSTSGQATIPMGWLSLMPSTNARTFAVVLVTYEGDREVGRTVSQAVVVAPPSSAPAVTLTVSRLLTVGGVAYPDLGVYVQGKCGYRAAVTQAAGQYGATIASYQITGGGYSGTAATLDSGLVQSAGDLAITCRVTDSRGITATQTATINVRAYDPPKPTSWLGMRVDDAGNPAPMGVKGRVYAAWSYSSLGGANTCTATAVIKIGGQWQPISGIAQGTWSSVTQTLSTTDKYPLVLRLTDKYGQHDYPAEISSAKYVIHFGADGESIAFLKAADKKGVEIAPDAAFYSHGKEIAAWMGEKTELVQLWSGSWTSGSITLTQPAAGYRMLAMHGAGGVMLVRPLAATHASARYLWGNNGQWHVVDNLYYIAVAGAQLTLLHSIKQLNNTSIGAADAITLVYGIK